LPAKNDADFQILRKVFDMAKTILFVDEEQFIRKALKRSFRKMRGEWEMTFAGSPDEALQALMAAPCDVVVTETVFSGESGLEFLKAVREKHPHSVRIILSGYADQNVVLQSVNIAHQYLAKPCEDETLKATIARAFLMKELLDNDALKQVVSKIDSLPSVPALYLELVEELKSEDASIDRIGEIISKDMGLITKILKLVNSSYFGLRQHISNPARAISLLGIDLIKAIVLTTGTLDKYQHLKFADFSIEQLWEHAMLSAAYAKTIAQDSDLKRKDADSAFMSALLHDIGKLLIATHMPEKFTEILSQIRQESCSMFQAESEIIGTSHAAIGAYLLGLWGLPDDIIDAAAFHHSPGDKPFNGLNTTIITHIANAFANAGPEIEKTQSIIAGLDYGYLENIDLPGSLPSMQKACAAHRTGRDNN
jgi:putative nucleotidyltransferase with HDIG domain